MGYLDRVRRLFRRKSKMEPKLDAETTRGKFEEFYNTAFPVSTGINSSDIKLPKPRDTSVHSSGWSDEDLEELKPPPFLETTRSKMAKEAEAVKEAAKAAKTAESAEAAKKKILDARNRFSNTRKRRGKKSKKKNKRKNKKKFSKKK
jgi:hypothetical protein